MGFRVRGTVCTQGKIAALERLLNDANYSSIVVADMATPGAFDEAVQGVDAILITAMKLPDDRTLTTLTMLGTVPH